jgi:hypothetical protein
MSLDFGRTQRLSGSVTVVHTVSVAQKIRGGQAELVHPYQERVRRREEHETLEYHTSVRTHVGWRALYLSRRAPFGARRPPLGQEIFA